MGDQTISGINSILRSKYARIVDSYSSLSQVCAALRKCGLESSNLIIGIDFTKSNEWLGEKSFNKKSLHHLGDTPNPYEQVITIIGKTLSFLDDDKLIPCFGFGDVTTHDKDVFNFYPDKRPCNGFEEVLSRYREIVPHISFAGPTSFAPIIENAIKIVDDSCGQYHILLIIADGQVTSSIDVINGPPSPQERKTIDAIVKASEYPLSIIMVGVGDGPWDTMKQFDDNIPARAFDNFQFLDFTKLKLKNTPESEAAFALAALMEIPSQYSATIDLKLLGRQRGDTENVVLPTPTQAEPRPATIRHGANLPINYNNPFAPSSSSNEECPVCYESRKNLAFGCGHQTCEDCGKQLIYCPICRIQITSKLKLYG